MKLLLIRHAESEGNDRQQMLGQLEDPLSPHGIWQAQLLGQFLAEQVGHPTHLYSSPLQRAVVTLDILRVGYTKFVDPLPIQTADALLEIHNGIFQGLTWDEALQQHPQICQQLLSTEDWIPIPGGETLQECCDRTHHFICSLYQTHNNADCIWIVTHGGIMQYLIAAILGTPTVWGIQIDNTALFEFDLTLPWQPTLNPQRCRIRRFNARPHLPSDRIHPVGDETVQ